MTPKQGYHLAVISNAPINNSNGQILTELARMKGQLLIELSARIEAEDAAEKAKAEAEKVNRKPDAAVVGIVES